MAHGAHWLLLVHEGGQTGTMQTPAMQLDGAAQAAPHPPQCSLLRRVSTQAPPQEVVPEGQTHSPSVQRAPVGQTFPHLPQCDRSFDTHVAVPAHTSTRGAARHPTSPLNTATRAGT